MLTAITHHRFGSRAWGEQEISRLCAELTEIDVSAAQVLAPRRGASALIRRPAERSRREAQEAC
jgi:hypothetical protein